MGRAAAHQTRLTVTPVPMTPRRRPGWPTRGKPQAFNSELLLGHGMAALYRPGGSIAFTAAARAVLALAKAPEDEERRVLAPERLPEVAEGVV